MPITSWNEPEITINGHPLTKAEAMAVRVAVNNFRIALADPRTRRTLGTELAAGYDDHLAAVELAMRVRVEA